MLTPGTRVGSFEVVGQLGVGGMGEVYRARDTKLGRDVALKVLPAAFTGDPERVARFKREAQVLASLNHPNIAAIYGLDEVDGQQFLTMELVEGQTLDARLSAQQRLPLDEALATLRQLVDALEAAHEKGIIHRDLKPANIAITGDGQVKVLDFGLAKALDPAPAADQSMSPTITFAATQAGVILGTAAYMSPEQAKGRVADKRSDIWSLGCVLFEMLAGKRPFEGEDVSDTLAAVLRADPEWSALPNDLPPPIDRILRRALEKDRRQRLGDVSTIRFLLEEPLAAGAGTRVALGTDTPVRPPTSRWALVTSALAIALAAGALGGAIVWRASPRPPVPMVSRFVVPLGEGQLFTNVTDLMIAISPDGSRIAYAAKGRIYIRAMGELEAQPVRGTEGNPRRPMFSPDGQSIAFFSPGERALKRLSIAGGTPVTVATVESAVAPMGGTWSGDAIYFGVFGITNFGIVRAPASGGKLEVVAGVAREREYADAPQLLPDGDHLIFTLGRGTVSERWEKSQIVVQSLKTGERKVLVDAASDGRYMQSGHLLYAQGGIVFAVRFDARRLQVVSGPVPVIEGVRRAVGGSGAAQFSVSETGSLIYIPGPAVVGSARQSVLLLDRKGGTESLKLQPGPYRDPRLSPDGKQLALATDDGKEAIVWVYDVSGASSIRRLTHGGKNRFPVWSADGQRILFQSDREGDAAIFWQRADGTGAAERLTTPESGSVHVPESSSPDGKWLLFSSTTTKDNTVSSMQLSLDERKVAPFGGIRSINAINATFSPDGKWVAYTARTPGSMSQIFVQPFPPTGVPYQVTKAVDTSPHHPFWSRDGRDLYFVPGPSQFAYVGVTTQPTFAFTDPVALSRGPFSFVEGGPTNTRQNDAAPDGRVVAVSSGDPIAGEPAMPQIDVVINWLEDLKARVPAK